MIKAITFDLWDTVFIDDSDEPKRAAAGRPAKAVERRTLVKKYVEKHTEISVDQVNAVYNVADLAFSKVWHEHFVTWSVRERLDLILKGIGITLPDNEMNELVRLHEEMELEFRPDIVPDIKESLDMLRKEYRLGVISDAIFSPGRSLRKLLEYYGLLEYFDVFIFSDEIGHSKPEPSVFLAACKGLGVEPDELVHIGDREHNDILGPKKLGVHAILCTTAIDRGSNNTKADAVFSNYRELYKIIGNLEINS